jgi:hypothetical protein
VGWVGVGWGGVGWGGVGWGGVGWDGSGWGVAGGKSCPGARVRVGWDCPCAGQVQPNGRKSFPLRLTVVRPRSDPGYTPAEPAALLALAWQGWDGAAAAGGAGAVAFRTLWRRGAS